MTKRVAVLGGGQLGWMLGIAGGALGVECRFLDPSPDATASAVGELVIGALDDFDAVDRACAGADVVTYEWEGVPASVARHAGEHAPVLPPPRALEVAQDRLVEKVAFLDLGIGTTPFSPIDGIESIREATHGRAYPFVLKTRFGGYDGRGQAVIRSADDIEFAWTVVNDERCVLEHFVDFTRELSIVAVRDVDGDIACWPVVENEHREGILRCTRAPAPGIDDALQARAEACIRPLLDALDYVGVACVELFETPDGLLANEIAPRVHNSGHWTIEGAATSQFENHLRAVLGRPLGPTHALGAAAMVNCIGALPDAVAIAAVPGAILHDYRKEPRPRRKLGHVTIVADDAATLEPHLAAVRELVVDDG